jgi:hypothetical protein
MVVVVVVLTTVVEDKPAGHQFVGKRDSEGDETWDWD